jgi:hypothetical protein
MLGASIIDAHEARRAELKNAPRLHTLSSETELDLDGGVRSLASTAAEAGGTLTPTNASKRSVHLKNLRTDDR